MKPFITTGLKAGFATFALLLAAPIVAPNSLTPTAQAQVQSAKAIVDAAVAKGLIGETASGYLADTGAGASREAINAMNEINIKRKGVYTHLARGQNVSVEVVAALTGEKLVASAQAGEKVMDKSGRWATK